MAKLSREHYTADAAIVWCFDNRFWPAFLDFIKEKQFAHFDPIIVAGGAKGLGTSSAENDKDFLIKQIETSIKLHHTKKLVLMTHEDCGAFGGSHAFENNKEKERTHHRTVLAAAKSVAAEQFPEINIETYFVHFEGYNVF